MKAVIRLYKCHDMDLLLLKMVYHVNLAKTAKLCLKAFVDHENIVFLPCESPDPEIKYVYKKSQTKQTVRQIQFPTQSFVLRLNDDTEAPYITFWNSIIPGYRTMFLKQLLRMYLRMPALSEYLFDISGLQHTEYLNPPIPYEIPLLQKDGMRQQESSSVWEHKKTKSRKPFFSKKPTDTRKNQLQDFMQQAKENTVSEADFLQTAAALPENNNMNAADDAEELMNYMAAWMD